MFMSCLSAFPRHLLYHQLTEWSLWVGLVQLQCVSLAASSKLIICPSFSYYISTLLLWPDLPCVPCSVYRLLPCFAGCLPWYHGLHRTVTVIFPFQFSFMLEQSFYSWTKAWKQTLLHLFLLASISWTFIMCQALWWTHYIDDHTILSNESCCYCCCCFCF